MTPAVVSHAPHAFWSVALAGAAIGAVVAKRLRGTPRERIARFVATSAALFLLTLGVTSAAALGPATSTPYMTLALASPATRAKAAARCATNIRIGPKDDGSADTLVALDLAAGDCEAASRDAHDLHRVHLVATVEGACGPRPLLARTLWENGEVTAAADMYEAARRERPTRLEPEEILAYVTAGRYELAARTARNAAPDLEPTAMTIEVLGGLRTPPSVAVAPALDFLDFPVREGPALPNPIRDANHLADMGRTDDALAQADAFLAAHPPLVFRPDIDPRAWSETEGSRRPWLVLAQELALGNDDPDRATRYYFLLLGDTANTHAKCRIDLLRAHSEANARACGFDDRTPVGKAVLAGDGDTLARALRLQPNVLATIATVGKTLPRGRDALAVLVRTEAPLPCSETERDTCDPRSLLRSLTTRARAARAVGDTRTANTANEAAARLRASREPSFSAEQLESLASIGGSVRSAVPRPAP